MNNQLQNNQILFTINSIDDTLTTKTIQNCKVTLPIDLLEHLENKKISTIDFFNQLKIIDFKHYISNMNEDFTLSEDIKIFDIFLLDPLVDTNNYSIEFLSWY